MCRLCGFSPTTRTRTPKVTPSWPTCCTGTWWRPIRFSCLARRNLRADRMLFNSFEFAIFFPVVTLLYFALPDRARVPLLLVASCWFYMAFIPKYILILAVVILVDYSAGILIANAAGRRRRLILILSLCTNIGILAFFKYFNFFEWNVSALARLIGWNYGEYALSIILPIGLSFHTFQSMSYTIEVYRGAYPAE